MCVECEGAYHISAAGLVVAEHLIAAALFEVLIALPTASHRSVAADLFELIKRSIATATQAEQIFCVRVVETGAGVGATASPDH